MEGRPIVANHHGTAWGSRGTAATLTPGGCKQRTTSPMERSKCPTGHTDTGDVSAGEFRALMAAGRRRRAGGAWLPVLLLVVAPNVGGVARWLCLRRPASASLLAPALVFKLCVGRRIFMVAPARPSPAIRVDIDRLGHISKISNLRSTHAHELACAIGGRPR